MKGTIFSVNVVRNALPYNYIVVYLKTKRKTYNIVTSCEPQGTPSQKAFVNVIIELVAATISPWYVPLSFVQSIETVYPNHWVIFHVLVKNYYVI